MTERDGDEQHAANGSLLHERRQGGDRGVSTSRDPDESRHAEIVPTSGTATVSPVLMPTAPTIRLNPVCEIVPFCRNYSDELHPARLLQ